LNITNNDIPKPINGRITRYNMRREPTKAGILPATTETYCGWLRNPAPPKGWLKPYE
jgi:hypothetical protein